MQKNLEIFSSRNVEKVNMKSIMMVKMDRQIFLPLCFLRNTNFSSVDSDANLEKRQGFSKMFFRYF